MIMVHPICINFVRNWHSLEYVLACRFVVIAGDISPIDVISHIPIACEDNKVPYAYVPSKFVSSVFPIFFFNVDLVFLLVFSTC